MIAPAPILARPDFWAILRAKLFEGHMTELQVEGVQTIVNYISTRPPMPVRFSAYMLATVFHETGQAMQPIEEVGQGVGYAYHAGGYWGRGYVQLTWACNYSLWATRLKLDLLHHPELALTTAVALPVLVDGMTLGLFTGRSLARFFTPTSSDPVRARCIINGNDCAVKISEYYAAFLEALLTPAPALKPSPAIATADRLS